MAGLGNKNGDFWEGLREWDVLVLSEMRVDEKGWIKIRGRLPKGYKWAVQWAKGKSRKGRATGGIMMDIRKKLVEEGGKIETKTEGLMVRRVRREEERWRIVGVYVEKRKMGRLLQESEGWIEIREEAVMTIVGENFNAKIGNEGGGAEVEEKLVAKRERRRKSKDSKINKKKRLLVGFIKERGWMVLNGG